MNKTYKLHAIVKGRVQGVFFRASTVEEAKKIGLFGWVRNLPNGDVETEAYGPKPQLKSFIEYLHDGPQMAKVERVDYSLEEFDGQPPLNDFFIDL